PAEQAGPVEQVVPRATATRSMVARPPGQVEQVELVRQAGVPPTRRAAYLVRMSVRLAPPPVVPAAVRPAVVLVPPGTARPLAVPGPVVVRLLEAGRARVPPAVRTVAPVAWPTVALRVTVPVARRVTRRVVRLLPQATVSPLGSARPAAVLVARAAARAGHRPVVLAVLAVPALVV